MTSEPPHLVHGVTTTALNGSTKASSSHPRTGRECIGLDFRQPLHELAAAGRTPFCAAKRRLFDRHIDSLEVIRSVLGMIKKRRSHIFRSE
jgi:hypothetical protein